MSSENRIISAIQNNRLDDAWELKYEQTLNIIGNGFDDEDLERLGILLENNESLINLSIINTCITDEGLPSFINSLKKNNNLKHLCVEGNDGMTDKHAAELVNLIKYYNLTLKLK